MKLGAGNTVELIPSTPYTRERFGYALADFKVDPRHPDMNKYVRTTIADAQGNFEFTNIPAGDYVVACLIQWELPSSFIPQYTGAQAIKFVTVKDGEEKKIVLTK